MKNVFLSLMAALIALSASAQNDKLNFEAPLFGVTKKNVKPKWSVVAFGGIQAGYSYRNVESPIRSSGLYGELDLVDFRLRPWRNGHVFSWGLSRSFDVQRLAKGTVYGQDGSFIGKPASWIWARSHAAESVTSLNRYPAQPVSCRFAALSGRRHRLYAGRRYPSYRQHVCERRMAYGHQRRHLVQNFWLDCRLALPQYRSRPPECLPRGNLNTILSACTTRNQERTR